MPGRIHISIAETPISCDQALAFLDEPAHGAVCSFIGRVRDHNLGKQVRSVSYDVFDELALNTFQAIAAEAQQRWGDGLNIWLEHYKGRLGIGGISIMIAVSSPHRDEAFHVCRFVIESVKHRSPIWKQEHYVNGDSDWVKGHALCQHTSNFLSCDNPTLAFHG
jgi:molybdopterin synthase catalytic subunit